MLQWTLLTIVAFVCLLVSVSAYHPVFRTTYLHVLYDVLFLYASGTAMSLAQDGQDAVCLAVGNLRWQGCQNLRLLLLRQLDSALRATKKRSLRAALISCIYKVITQHRV